MCVHRLGQYVKPFKVPVKCKLFFGNVLAVQLHMLKCLQIIWFCQIMSVKYSPVMWPLQKKV